MVRAFCPVAGSPRGQVERRRLGTQRRDVKDSVRSRCVAAWRVLVTVGCWHVSKKARGRCDCHESSSTIGGKFSFGTSVARHPHNFTFLTACLAPARTWGLTFGVVPFVTWSAFCYNAACQGGSVV